MTDIPHHARSPMEHARDVDTSATPIDCHQADLVSEPETIWVAGIPQECGDYFSSCVEAEGAWGGVGAGHSRISIDDAARVWARAVLLPEAAWADAEEALN
jgi:hypothetical protein